MENPNQKNCQKFLKEFNLLTPQERYEFLAYSEREGNFLREDVFKMALFAIKNAGDKIKNVVCGGLITGVIDGEHYSIKKSPILNKRTLSFEEHNKLEVTIYDRQCDFEAIEAEKKLSMLLTGIRRK
jgi:hypothetical protein